MQNAQKHLLSSFIRKNEMMALVLEQNATQIENKLNQQQKIKHSDLSALRISAEAYRGHEERERDLISRFEKASSKLISEVQKCLVSESTP